MACCLLEIPSCLLIFGFTRWTLKRCMIHGSMSSEDWPVALPEDFRDVPRVCRMILGVYEEDLSHPDFVDRLIVENVVKRCTYADTRGKCPPYLIYIDHEARDVSLVVRGLHLGNVADYAILANNRKGQQNFDGGFVHHGLLNAALWLLEEEFATLKEQLEKHPGYGITLGGHSLGSGVVSLLTIMIVNNLTEFGRLTRDKVKCFAVAPARCMSMNLAVKYADVINSVVLQDDFLPRTTVPLSVIFGAALCLPCLLVTACIKDTLISNKRKLRDPRRLYAPGRLYHIVYTKYGSCKRYTPEVKTAIPVNGRFENLVCSINSTEDHSLVAIEVKASLALQNLVEMEKEAMLEPPSEQKMSRSVSRKDTQAEELKSAMQSAVDLGVNNAADPATHPSFREAVIEAATSDARAVVRLEEVEEADSKEEGSEDRQRRILRERFLKSMMQKEEEKVLVKEEQEKAERTRLAMPSLKRWLNLIELAGMQRGKFPNFSGTVQKEASSAEASTTKSRWKKAAVKGKEIVAESVATQS